MELAAGFWVRLGAGLLDGIIIALPLSLLLYVMTGNPDHFIYDILMLLYTILIPVYFNGKTLGKHICKIKIVEFDLQGPPTLWIMVKRHVIFALFIVFSLGIVFIIDVFFVIFREDKRALHDLFANSAVIYDVQ